MKEGDRLISVKVAKISGIWRMADAGEIEGLAEEALCRNHRGIIRDGRDRIADQKDWKVFLPVI